MTNSTIEWDKLEWVEVDVTYKPITPRDLGYPFDTWEEYNFEHKIEHDYCPTCGRE